MPYSKEGGVAGGEAQLATAFLEGKISIKMLIVQNVNNCLFNIIVHGKLSPGELQAALLARLLTLVS